MSRFDWLVLVLILLVFFIYSVRKAKSSDESYLLANRSTKLFPLVATLVMTEFNPATLLSFSAAGYYAGLWALFLPSVFLFGLLFYAFSVAKKWKEYNGISVAHYFKQRYSQSFAYAVAVILFCAMLGFCASYIKSLTLIFNPLMPELNPWLLGLIIISLILALSLKGGLTSIIRLDQISFIFILFFIPFLVYKSSQLSVNQGISLSQGQQILTPGFVLSLVALTMFSYILAPWYGQKIISAQNKQTARLAVIVAAIIITLLYSGGILAVYALKKHGVVLANPDTAFPYLIKLVLPNYTQGIAYAALFMIGATTIAGVWSSMVTLIVGELPAISNSLQRNYILALITALLCYLIANTLIDNILNKMILANIPIVGTAFALLAGFYWPRANNFAAYLSLVVGIIWGVACYIAIGDIGGYTRYWAFYGIPLIFITGIIITLVTTKKIDVV